jgi:hypothetical protein
MDGGALRRRENNVCDQKGLAPKLAAAEIRDARIFEDCQ